GTLIAGAAAYAAPPFNAAAIDPHESSERARVPPFSVFAFMTGRSGGAWRDGESPASLSVGRDTFGSAMPAVSGVLRAIADERGARIELAGRRLAAADMGVVLGVFRPDGTFWRALEFTSGERLQ